MNRKTLIVLLVNICLVLIVLFISNVDPISLEMALMILATNGLFVSGCMAGIDQVKDWELKQSGHWLDTKKELEKKET